MVMKYENLRVCRMLHVAQTDLLAAFQRETSQRCVVAQAQFDRITNHGLNAFSEHDAMARALEAEAATR